MGKKIRYGVVGLGHIAQVAVLPAFNHAKENSVLAAFVSDDLVKLRELGKTYGVTELYTNDRYEELLRSGKIDAVYIALPNDMHREYAVRAAEAGIHVLCEKPMAITVPDCQDMIIASQKKHAKLMIAYRLHFEESNLDAVEIVRQGRDGPIGEARFITSAFAFPPSAGNIRTQREKGGGPLYDIGIYCINAARYLYQDEPIEVSATITKSQDPKLADIEESVSATLRFPRDRLASFTVSYGTAPVAWYEIVGTKGSLRAKNAYEYVEKIEHVITSEGKESRKTYAKRDQFAPELVYFSNCILENKEPEPSGLEGLADIRVIRAIFHAAQTGKSVELGPFDKGEYAGKDQEIHKPAVARKPDTVHVQEPSKDIA